MLLNTPAILYEYSMIMVKKSKTGEFSYDYSIMQRYIDLCNKYGINGDFTLYGLNGIWNMPYFEAPEVEGWPEKVMIRYLDEESGCYRYMDKKEDILGYISSLVEYFERIGQIDKVRIASDEPANIEKYRESIQLIRSVAPQVKFKAAFDHTKFIHDFAEDIYDCASSFPCSCTEHSFLKKHKEENPEKRFLWYVCNIPDKPNTYLRSDLLEARFLGSLGYLFGYDGFLRWAYTCWPLNPRSDIRYNDAGLPAGDVGFIYPTMNGDITKSLRWKALKRGIEDYELLIRLKEHGEKDCTEKALEYIVLNKDFQKYMKTDRITVDGIFSTNYDDYASMRDYVLEELSK